MLFLCNTVVFVQQHRVDPKWPFCYNRVIVRKQESKMNIKNGDCITWKCAAGNLTGTVANIVLADNAKNKTVPWLVVTRQYSSLRNRYESLNVASSDGRCLPNLDEKSFTSLRMCLTQKSTFATIHT